MEVDKENGVPIYSKAVTYLTYLLFFFSCEIMKNKPTQTTPQYT